MDKLLVVIAGLALIGFILWWFFGKRNNEAVAAEVQAGKQKITITVDGGYVPNTVTLKQGVPATLIFNRKDPSGCLDEVVFPDFGISEKLPLGKTHEIAIDTAQAGEFKYACGMNMLFGKVVIK